MLREILTAHNIGPLELGRAVKQTGGRNAGQPFGIAAMSQLINHRKFPRSTPEEEVRQQIEKYLTDRGVTPDELKGLWTAGGAADQGEETTSQEDKDMLPPKASVTNAVKKHFKIMKAPFGDVETDPDMFMSGSVRYSREFMLDKVRNGGFGAIIGESGSGKSTLVEDVEEYIANNGETARLIRPMICGMDTDSGKGSPLKARSILLTIMDAVAPNAPRPSDLPRLTAAVQRALADRHGERRFCLIIDDAHRLSGPTLAHLKDFYELKVGRKRLLGIVLMGQLPLGTRLDPHNPEVVQITQRCETHYLPPLGADLEAYIERRLTAVGASAAAIFAPDAYAAIRARLTAKATEGNGSRKLVNVDVTYPLAVNNLCLKAMSLAAELGAPLVTADVVREA